MAKTPERKVKDRVVVQLKELGAYYFYPVTSGFGASGVPDIIACYEGRFFAFECKARGNKPTALQQLNIDRINGSGGTALVINEDNVNEVQEILRTWNRTDQGTRPETETGTETETETETETDLGVVTETDTETGTETETETELDLGAVTPTGEGVLTV